MPKRCDFYCQRQQIAESYQIVTSTPAVPSNNVITPSKTLRDRSTSRVKSMWPNEYRVFVLFTGCIDAILSHSPGVSSRLILCASQVKVTDADVIVMPLARSCSTGHS